MTRRPIVPNWLPLGLTAIAFAAANGIGYGGGNLHQYLLHGLHTADPSFLANDWFTVETRPHHVLFTALLATTARVVPPHLALGILNVLASSIFVVCVHAMARRLHPRPLLITATTLIIILGCPRTLIALVSMITSYFQPSTVGALGLLGGMILLARRRWPEAALTLAIGGAFHIGYAIWVELLIAAVLIRHHRLLGMRRCVLFAGVAALVGAFHAPFFIVAHGPDQLPWSAQAGQILHDVYMPYHSRPRTWPAEQWISAACVLAAGAIAVSALRRPRRTTDIERTLAAFVAVISTFGIVLTLVFEWDVMAMLLPYRVLLLAILAAQVAAAAALICPPPRDRPWILSIAIQTLIFVLLRRSGMSEYAGTTVAFAGGAAIVGRAARDARLDSLRAGGISVLVCVLVGLAGAGRNTLAAGVALTVIVLAYHRLNHAITARLIASRLIAARLGVAVILLFQLTWMARAAAERKDFLCEPYPASQIELFDWCRNNTPADAIFAIPPDLAGFRLNARRATVIDCKCMPILPADTVRWAARLADLCGRPIRSMSDAITGYRELDMQRAIWLNERYGASYVIIEKLLATASYSGLGKPLFSNEIFDVHLIEPARRRPILATVERPEPHLSAIEPSMPN